MPKEEKPKPKGQQRREDENIVYVGQKPTMNYVLAVVTQVNAGEKEIIVQARGRSIGKAVDIAEISRNRFVAGMKLKNIDIGTEQLTGEGGKLVNVSYIRIFLTVP